MLISSLSEKLENEVLTRIHIYSCTDYVVQLLTRLLDKKYKMENEHDVMHAEKEISADKEGLERDLKSNEDIWLWQEEAGIYMEQRNISEKAVWLAGRR